MLDGVIGRLWAEFQRYQRNPEEIDFEEDDEEDEIDQEEGEGNLQDDDEIEIEYVDDI